MPRRPHVPTYRSHRSSGQAVVTVNGKDHYLGHYDSPESRERYAKLIGQYLAGGGAAKPTRGYGYTVAHIAIAYLEHARTYYVKDGKVTSQVERIERSLAHATKLYGDMPADEFGPRKLVVVRDSMVAAGWTRRHVNSCVGCVKAAFKWAVANELVPSGVYEAMRAVAGLKAGRCTARESEPIGPAPEKAVAAVLGVVLYVVADMIRVQLLAGMRSGELVRMRPMDIDRTGPVWIYRPHRHKTEHKGKVRVVFLGPQAQQVLASYLDRPADAYLFSPREAMAASVLKKRRKPGPPAPVFTGRRAPGLRYTPTSYSQAIRQACIRAKVQKWFPHALRHSFATATAAAHGIEVARVLLGHSSVDTTTIYAERDARAAMDVMRNVG